ncbi:MAG: LexA family transcriptional regulator [Sphingomonas sp.]|nr:LexA family transcriptional regulator [Sphingomonas sp.]MDX3884063.1 LexA family transcriptional regulator [Sphingomonas sp.]
MNSDITHYASLRKAKLTQCGMVRSFAVRNMDAMKTNGLKAARKKIGLKQPEIAERLGVSVAQISRWENGHDNIPSSRLPAVAKAYESNLGELFDGQEPVSGPTILEGAIPVAPIPHLGGVPAGNWREAVRNSHRFIPAPQPGMPSDAYALTVEGDSMDKIVRDGATIIVDPTDLDLFDKRLFVVRNPEGEVTFKQYLEGPARLVPCSNNPEHRTIPIGGGEFTILGRVILITMSPDQAALG